MSAIVERYIDGDPDLQETFSDSFDYESAELALEEIHELAFEDWDVLMLFDSAWDGLGEEGDSIGETLDMANLHVDDWFTPFRPEGLEEIALREPSPELDL
jgi:hypothetical protein